MKHEKKVSWKGSTLLGPVPAVLIGCGDNRRFRFNLITVAWAGTVCSEPPQLSISIRKERYSYGAIDTIGDFTVNIPDADMVENLDLCGVISGRDGDKFSRGGLTPLAAEKVNAPIVAEAPLVLECRVNRKLELGSHDMFIADILNIQVSENLLDDKGKLDIKKADLIAYAHGAYFRLGEALGTFGFSVRKKKK